MKDYRILLVEDDHDIRELVYEILSAEGFKCTKAIDGLAAIEMLKSETFDLLITDFQMPRLNGVQLLDWCRESKIHFPVIFISASMNLLPEEEVALSDCCASVLEKPMDADAILNAIEEARKRNHHLECFNHVE
jgi:DNA-binding response OmpR family regulator